jgi:hypothetical protein
MWPYTFPTESTRTWTVSPAVIGGCLMLIDSLWGALAVPGIGFDGLLEIAYAVSLVVGLPAYALDWWTGKRVIVFLPALYLLRWLVVSQIGPAPYHLGPPWQGSLLLFVASVLLQWSKMNPPIAPTRSLATKLEVTYKNDPNSLNPLRRKAVDPLRMRALDWIIRGLLAADGLLFILTFIPAFSGIGNGGPGLADRIWGHDPSGGWRGEVVWMCLSTVVILVGGLRPTAEPGAERTTSNLCWAWLACFVVYLGYVVMHMFG